MSGIDSFGSPVLADVQFEQDGSLKKSGKQNIKFFNKKILSFRAKPMTDSAGNVILDSNGKPRFQTDPKTGLPYKEAFEDVQLFVRVETKGDTNIYEDRANELHKRQFYRQYKHFVSGKVPEGNPIEDFDFLQPSTVMELHMLGIHVIQQVAEMSDLECEQLKDQPGYEIRDIAAQWVRINTPQGQAMKASKLESELAKVKRELEQLKGGARFRPEPEAREPMIEEPAEPEQQIETLEMTAEELSQVRRGRPRKV